MAKRYKTWEVFKMLTEKPGLKFKLVQTRPDVSFTIETTIGYSNIFFNAFADGEPWELNGNIATTSEWELVKKPVTFMEAVKAFKEGKMITCDFEGHTYKYNGKIDDQMVDAECNAVSCEEILDGKWFIEEEE